MAPLSRRHFIFAGSGALAATSGSFSALSQITGETEHHGMSAFGDLGYPQGFTHLNYVNPNAPKGGIFSQLAGAGSNTFNSLNGFILRGDPAVDMELVFASLMARAQDEPDAIYGLAAERVMISADRRTYRFDLRKNVKFHDGSPITAADVVFSLSILKAKGHPYISLMLRDMEAVEADGDRRVAIRFAPKRSPEAALVAARLPIFSAAYYSTRQFDVTTLEPPLGSGPYRVGKFEQGRFLEFDRVTDWWGTDLPVMRGKHNFDVLRYDYFRDRETAFEAFTAKNYVFREEFTARVWSTRYDFPAARQDRVRRQTIPDERPAGAQGWMINTRRQKFRDRRLREALARAFDFEWANHNLMFDCYARIHSYFQNSEMMAKGLPAPDELSLLESFRGKVSDEVLGEAWLPPVNAGSGHDRRHLRRSSELLAEAGWTIKDGKRLNEKGEPLTIEFLLFDRVSEPHHALFIKSLTTLGIECSMRMVDPVQFRARTQDFDFDIAMNRLSFESIPGDTLRSCFSSQAANTRGSANFAGIADPVVDALIERAIAAPDRASLNTTCRVLDRVLRAGQYWIAHWYKPAHWIAYWDLFGRPEIKPRYARGIPETWWYDRDKAAKVER